MEMKLLSSNDQIWQWNGCLSQLQWSSVHIKYPFFSDQVQRRDGFQFQWLSIQVKQLSFNFMGYYCIEMKAVFQHPLFNRQAQRSNNSCLSVVIKCLEYWWDDSCPIRILLRCACVNLLSVHGLATDNPFTTIVQALHAALVPCGSALVLL